MTDGMMLTAAEPVAGLEVPRRRISGVALVFGPTGASSAGPTRFESGAMVLPDDLSRVKLLLDHDSSDPVGYLESATVSGTSLVCTFVVADGERGDLALSHASSKLRDGLSVGTSISSWYREGDVIVVTAATLHEVSLVSIPAFADARVIRVNSARKETLFMPSEKEPATTPPVLSADQLSAIRSQVSEAMSSFAADLQSAAPSEPPEPATTPAPPVAPAGSKRLDFSGMVQFCADLLHSGAPPQTLTAALADVTPVSSKTATTQEGPNSPDWVGELWQAADVERPVLDSLSVGVLRSLKMKGARWKVRPQVGRYAGNKAEIPTNTPTREVAEWDAQRIAGGWDVDRVYVDLPGTDDFDMLAEIFKEAMRDYLVKSEAYAVERILAEGTKATVAANTSLPALLTQMGAEFGTIRGSRLGVVQLGVTRWSDFLNMKESDAPWWLRAQGAISITDTSADMAGIKLRVNPDLPAGAALAIDPRAVMARESAPIKVQALDIPKGGVDLGVFGYIAAGVTDSRLVRYYTPAP